MAWIQLVAIALFTSMAISKDIVWQRPGCHKVGHMRKIEIPDCVQFNIDTNACRGYCESYAIPSLGNPFKPITSIGECCNIMETEDVHVILNCLGGQKNLTFKSATKCSCYNCKTD